MHRIIFKNILKSRINILKIYSQPIRLKTSSFKDEIVKDYELHKPGENFKAENYIITEHTQRLLKEHLQQTGGQVRTRFAPEPNGLLHIGHAKAININFGYAEAQGGICFIRFDDTNPEMEDEKFAEGIVEIIQWLGFQPYQVTYASDYFQQLYEWAEKLIENDLAYVCHQPPGTDNTIISPWRKRPTEESLHEFKAMKNKHYKEGEATLRLKMTTDQQTIDPVAYRIKLSPHHRTKNDWCIYPTYDYAHSLCDSIQNITHSLCTGEFALRRSTYYWICNALQVYCPVQIEYGRLNLLHTVVSKRKINALIKDGIVDGWDDPRLYTLAGLRRRGIPPEVINTFCSRLGLKKDNSYIHPDDLDWVAREYLKETAPRIMAVLSPLKVVIVNFPDGESRQLRVPNISSDPSAGSHTITLAKEIWIEQTDFKETAGKDFRRLTKQQAVGLKHTSHVITLKEVVYHPSGEVDHLKAEFTPLKEAAKKPRAFIHWVSKPLEAEVRLYENIFNSERPDHVEASSDEFFSDLNPNSATTLKKALIGDSSLNQFLPYQRFQFERIGYFCVDSDSREDRIVFNRIVELKQDKGF